MPSFATAEVKFLVDNKEVAFNTSQAVETYIELAKVEAKLLCKGYLKANAAIVDLEKQTEFPLPNNQYPASDFVEGFLAMRSPGLTLGYTPRAFSLIWKNLTADKDKAFSAEERNNVVALWKHTMSWNSLNCGAQ